MFPSVEFLLAGTMFLAISAVAILAISALQGAGKPLGEAGLIEASPWIARIVPRVLIRLALIGRKDLVSDIDLEVQTLVDQTFRDLGDTANGRARAMLRVFGQSSSFIRRAQELRRIPRAKRLAASSSSTRKRAGGNVHSVTYEENGTSVVWIVDPNGRPRRVREYVPGPLPELKMELVEGFQEYFAKSSTKAGKWESLYAQTSEADIDDDPSEWEDMG